MRIKEFSSSEGKGVYHYSTGGPLSIFISALLLVAVAQAIDSVARSLEKCDSLTTKNIALGVSLKIEK